jgi:hypothetical protein
MFRWVLLAAVALATFPRSYGSVSSAVDDAAQAFQPVEAPAPAAPQSPAAEEARPAPVPMTTKPEPASYQLATASGTEQRAAAGAPPAAVAATAVPGTRVEYFVDPAGGDDSADGLAMTRSGNRGPWRSLGRANQAAAPGVTIRLAPGRYEDSIQPASSGSASGGFVTYAAASAQAPVLTATIELTDRAYVRLQGLRVQSPRGSYWLNSSTSSHHIEITGCVFDSQTRSADAFPGIYLRGRDHVIRGNSFGRWLGDMIWAVEGVQRVLIENNDFSRASGEHALVTIVGSDSVIRNNYFGNPWARVLHVTWNGDFATRRIVVENNLFVDSAWDRKRPHPARGDDRGSAEAIRFLASQSILRNNLVLATNAGTGWEINGALSFQSFRSGSVDSRHYENLRVYHNTIYRSVPNALSFSAHDSDLQARDNRFKNNVFAQAGQFVFAVLEETVPWQTYRFESNLCSAPGRRAQVFLAGNGGAMPIDAAERTFPGVFGKNITADPEFVSTTPLEEALNQPGKRQLSDREAFFQAFRLAPGSPGRGKAAPLASVSAAVSNGTRVTLDDALWFHDGLGVVEGDRVMIGKGSAVGIKKVVDARTLELDNPVTAAAGDGVWLEQAGRTADVGVYGVR